MNYFKDEKDNSELEQLYGRLADICLNEIMFSSDAYVCMINLNLQGYKRLHRVLTKKFYDLYLELQSDIVEKFHKTIATDQDFTVYKTDNIKTHLYNWNKHLENTLSDIGEIIKDIFEQEGYTPCIAQEIQKILYYNLIKNERAIKKFQDCDWSNEVIYLHDKHLHKKMKEKENRTD